MRKMLMTLTLVIVLLTPLMVGAQDEEVTLRVIGFQVVPEEMDTPLAQARLKVLEDFQAEHPNVTIEALETPPEFDTQLLVDLAAGTAPDVWYQDASTLARLVDTGNVLDMNTCLDLVPELTLDRFTPSFLDIHRRETGEIWGLPDGGTPMVIYYNPKSFDRAGVPYPQDGWTWDDLLETAQLLTLDAEGRNRLDPDFDAENVEQWGFRARKYTFEWIYRTWENGSDVIAPDGSTVSGYLDSPETIEAIKWMRDLALEYGVAPGPTLYDQMTQELGFLTLFLQGKVAMFDRGHWEMVGLAAHEDYEPGRVAVIGQPQNTNRATVIYESGWMINAALKDDPAKLLAACQFVNTLTDVGFQSTKVTTGLEISANAEAAAAAVEESEWPEVEKVFVDEAQYGRLPYGALYANWPTVESALDSMMEEILAGEEIEFAVQNAVDEINRELERAAGD
ncbi:MAG: sugar ABC transporter substrate-binding protein [Anaerolineae bacterium]|nr:sugar ABC transporter substrate-binding protein [Anaerolineae bacterium]